MVNYTKKYQKYWEQKGAQGKYFLMINFERGM